jgi:diphthamide biosynthesis enzyme Dph1/Dph2-like protein
VRSVQVYLLADTTFDSTAVDEVAAEHVDADCIIHYGHATLAPVRRIPTYFVLPRAEASAEAVVQQARRVLQRGDAASTPAAPLVVLLDLAYVHLRGAIADGLKVCSLARDLAVLHNVQSVTPPDDAADGHPTPRHRHMRTACCGHAGRQRRSIRRGGKGARPCCVRRSCCSSTL